MVKHKIEQDVAEVVAAIKDNPEGWARMYLDLKDEVYEYRAAQNKRKPIRLDS